MKIVNAPARAKKRPHQRPESDARKPESADPGSSGGPPPLIAHVIYALRAGGLENGLVNLINSMPPERYRHAIICLDGYDAFARRIRREDVALHVLGKRQGKDPGLYLRIWWALRQLQPDIVHTRNLATLEAQIPAALAGVPCRVHGEHGRAVYDLEGNNVRYQWLRRACRPFVHHFIALSRDLESYLRDRIGVPARRIARICNGVDTNRFRPRGGAHEGLPFEGLTAESVVIGTVGRMEPVKDPLNLVEAFLLLLERHPRWRKHLRLVMVGDGSLLGQAQAMLREGGAEHLAWLPGARDDVSAILGGLDLFVLPSAAEGISNTVLEAMATELPVVATEVGGNAELVEDGVTGRLVPCAHPMALADALAAYVESAKRRRAHGEAGRRRAEQEFGLHHMVEGYLRVYDALAARYLVRHRGQPYGESPVR